MKHSAAYCARIAELMRKDAELKDKIAAQKETRDRLFEHEVERR